jgi:hypothetical protein
MTSGDDRKRLSPAPVAEHYVDLVLEALAMMKRE